MPREPNRKTAVRFIFIHSWKHARSPPLHYPAASALSRTATYPPDPARIYHSNQNRKPYVMYGCALLHGSARSAPKHASHSHSHASDARARTAGAGGASPSAVVTSLARLSAAPRAPACSTSTFLTSSCSRCLGVVAAFFFAVASPQPPWQSSPPSHRTWPRRREASMSTSSPTVSLSCLTRTWP